MDTNERLIRSNIRKYTSLKEAAYEHAIASADKKAEDSAIYLQEFFRKGYIKGFREGFTAQELRTVINMLMYDIPANTILKCSDLNEEELDRLTYFFEFDE